MAEEVHRKTKKGGGDAVLGTFCMRVSFSGGLQGAAILISGSTACLNSLKYEEDWKNDNLTTLFSEVSDRLQQKRKYFVAPAMDKVDLLAQWNIQGHNVELETSAVKQ